jgi:coniferyl-aldehyde dehydrogenase
MDMTIETIMNQVFQEQRSAFRKHPLPPAHLRREHLTALKDALVRHQDALVEAIDDDFGGRAADETLMAEMFPSIEAVKHAASRVKRWMRPQRRHVHMLLQPARARIVYQPLGVVGIISPWNYPVFLTVAPLAGALAAGNRVMIKVSEFTPRTGNVLSEMLAGVFPRDHVSVVQGEADIAASFSRLPFGHLLFTGSTTVGHHVMRAAADNLTPVTLELGGKSPAIIHPEYPLGEAAERIAFGKCLNAGQTCIAPDYVLCPEDRIADFVAALSEAVNRMFPAITGNPDYTCIVNDRQYLRLRNVLDDARDKGAAVVQVNGRGENLDSTRKMPLHVVLDATDDMIVLQDEIFGPVLPVVPCADEDAAIDYVNTRPRPLALYYFDNDRSRARKVVERTHAGGVCINDTLSHAAQEELPFGGVGQSGMGHYHGHAGFMTFSKPKGVFEKGRINSSRLVYPPYGKWIHRLIYRFFLQ